MSATPIKFNTHREQTAYESGLKIVAEKIAAGRKAEAIRKVAHDQRTAQLVTKRMGGELASRCFGMPDARAEQLNRAVECGVAKAFAKLEAGTTKAPSKAVPSKAVGSTTKQFSAKTTHRFGFQCGLFGSRA